MMLAMATMVLAVVVPLSQGAPSPISMAIRSRSDQPTAKLVRINFYDNSFAKFYECLSNRRSLTCGANLSRDDKQTRKNLDKRIISVHKPVLTDESENFSDYFTYEYIFPYNKLSCHRLPAFERRCDVDNLTQYFHYKTEGLSRNSKCIGLRWKFPDEALLHDARMPNIIPCVTTCNLTTARPDHPWLLPIRPLNNDGSDHRHEDHSNRYTEDYLDNKSHIIIAVVCSIGVTAVLLVAAGFFRKKLLQKRNLTKETSEEDGKNKPISEKKISRRKSEPARKLGIPRQPRLSSIILNPAKLATSEI